MFGEVAMMEECKWSRGEDGKAVSDGDRAK
jgi:hypothetical protein